MLLSFEDLPTFWTCCVGQGVMKRAESGLALQNGIMRIYRQDRSFHPNSREEIPLAYFPKCQTISLGAAAFHLTDYPLSIFCSEADDLHLHIGSADGSEHQLHLVPHAEHRATQHVVRPAAESDFTLQTHRRLLTVPPPVEPHERQDWIKHILRWVIYVNSEAKKDKAGDILYLLASTNPEHFSKFWSKSLNTVFKVKQEEIVHLLGLLSVADWSSFDALVSICGRRTCVCGIMSHKLHCVCSLY